MDRRSWLWRRKSSEKSQSGEVESSGSLSSLSERFSDDQALSYHNAQSPEVTSKAAQEEELNDSVKVLSEKLSEALLNIQAKENLVKQHAKVAEEAVLGWEKAETEVGALKKQVENLTQKNSVLEERVGHLDGALKECLRQLRQAREEQEQNIYDAVFSKSCEWESSKSQLEKQLVELQSQFETATAEASKVCDLRTKLEAAEKENSILMHQLHSISEELKLRTCERDLSTHAAETASKQHLDSIKKVTRLEAECRRLKAVSRKAMPANELQSCTASSVYVESFADSQSDSGERLSSIENESCKVSGIEMNDSNHCKKEKPLASDLMAPSVDIDLMDDFLEMERLAALQEMEKRDNTDLRAHGGESHLKAELEAMINRTAELEDKLDMMETGKMKLEMSLNECKNQLKTTRDQLEEAELEMEDLKTQLVMATVARKSAEVEVEATNIKLKRSMEHLEKMEANLVECQHELATALDAKHKTNIELEATNIKLQRSTKRLEEMQSKIVELQTQLAITIDAKHLGEVELEAASTMKNEAESKLKAIELEMQSLQSKVDCLEEELRRERALADEAVAKSQKLENAGDFKTSQDKELAVAAHKFAECQNTIASLSRQLKSLATLEHFLIDGLSET